MRKLACLLLFLLPKSIGAGEPEPVEVCCSPQQVLSFPSITLESVWVTTWQPSVYSPYYLSASPVAPNNQMRARVGRRGWIFQRYNPNYFGNYAVGSGNRFVNIFGRQQIITDTDYVRDNVIQASQFTTTRTNTQTQTEPKQRRRLFGRR